VKRKGKTKREKEKGKGQRKRNGKGRKIIGILKEKIKSDTMTIQPDSKTLQDKRNVRYSARINPI